MSSNETITKPTGRGGPGRGQGRKPSSPSGKTRQRFEFKIDPEVLAWLRDHGEQPVGAMIEKAVIEHYGISFTGNGKTTPSL